MTAVLAPGEFQGTLPGLTEPVTDPKTWTPELVKSAGPYERTTNYQPDGVNTKHAQHVRLPPARRALFAKPRVTLTQMEREWLGASVRLVDRPGAVWQVWALHPDRSRVWIVREGVHDDQPVSNLSKVTVGCHHLLRGRGGESK